MKLIKVIFVFSLSAILGILNAQNMRAFTPGNFVVISQNISGGFTPVFIKEYTPSGNLVQAANLGTLAAPNNGCFLPNPNSGSSEYGYISRSGNGQFVSFAAFRQANATGNRVGALIKYDGTINTQTLFNNTDNPVFNPKSVVTADGKGLWLSTSHLSGDSNYIFYQPLSATFNPTQLIETPEKGLGFRQLNISAYDNSLYVTRGNSGFNAFSGLPTTVVSRTNRFPPINVKAPSPGGRGFCFVEPLNGGGEVMYISAVASIAASGSITENSNILTLNSANSNFLAGNPVTGPGIPAGAIIKSVEGTVVTISINATSTQTGHNFYTGPASNYGIYKYYRTSPKNAWTFAGGFGVSADNYLTVTAMPNANGGFTLYATKNVYNGGSAKYTTMVEEGTPQIVKIVDSALFNVNMAARETVIVHTTVNRDIFRGISMAPAVSSKTLIYYYKGQGPVDAVTSWGSNYEGSGTSPANFTTDNQVFILTNADTVDKINGKNWTVSGANSALHIGDGYRKIRFLTGTKAVTVNNEKISAKQVNYNGQLN